MKITLKSIQETEVTVLAVQARVRRSHSEINGNEEVDLTPFLNNKVWQPEIDIESGIIIGWPQEVEANIYFKVCDGCSIALKNSRGEVVWSSQEGYVPNILCPEEDGYGDYIIMRINGSGLINKWDKTQLQDAIAEN